MGSSYLCPAPLSFASLSDSLMDWQQRPNITEIPWTVSLSLAFCSLCLSVWLSTSLFVSPFSLAYNYFSANHFSVEEWLKRVRTFLTRSSRLVLCQRSIFQEENQYATDQEWQGRICWIFCLRNCSGNRSYTDTRTLHDSFPCHHTCKRHGLQLLGKSQHITTLNNIAGYYLACSERGKVFPDL